MRARILFGLLALLAFFACRQPAEPPRPDSGVEVRATLEATSTTTTSSIAVAGPRRLFSPHIGDAQTFEALSKQIGDERFTKLVVDLKSDAVHYFDVNVYPVHKDFIFSELFRLPKTKEAVRAFDKSYGTQKAFLMCYLVHHVGQDLWTFAFWEGDTPTAAHVRRASEKIKQTFYLGHLVRFRPDSAYQERVAAQTKDVPWISNDQIYKTAEYQPFNKGVAVGRLRLISGDVPQSDLTFEPDEIVILTSPLADISPVAGIISETFSTPLSHVNLRAKGWRIPNIGLRDAKKKLGAMAGKVVYLEARDSDFVARLATPEELERERKKHEHRRRVTIPEPNFAVTKLPWLDELTADDFRTVGPKAANLGIIKRAKLPGFEVPPGFGVPFVYARDHLAAHGLSAALAAVLDDPKVRGDAAARKDKLEALRKAIVDAPIDPVLCAKVAEELKALPKERGVFVRSSHNAEDLDDFSGAGLHDTVPNVKGDAAVCEAIKKVWASAWKQSAFDAREHAGIDQRKVAAGVLVQTGVAATAAGVMATAHPTDPDDTRHYTINAKSGLGMAVVDGRKVPEILMVNVHNRGIRILSRSDEETKLVFDEKGGVHEVPNPSRGKAVLTNQMAVDLAAAGKGLTKLFQRGRLDIEWVYEGDQLYIVQTRPLVTE
ncbi:MAG: PEP/pyruvate-binding domain-containing protein [Deltaproteobacteria bacterium]|nr:PEP/pyruvate-binding domain-containing protein [Deltaproteobacteria bacterium]